ncbi:phage antirepressor KilAC domain-containing protein [Gluconobacter cerevisiae]|uniref:Phage antirepressor KilAC domain-containing protein n=1 Tax=Gluconobacter cerevisiae TaxID=1379734 RepID=A0ABR9YF05_9PROT|nr:phage antirepressor KilAC domain-containing protein [Gluconobacter cerevisiae]MBF0877239.1 phage antirepressor KilAC domain-containing protein [Gluconobacter cerevisiae]
MSDVITKAVEGSNVIAPAMHDGELRILDTDLATCLGFDRPRDIRKLIKRYEAELCRMGRCATVARRPETGGHTVIEHYLNEEQALFITAKSETTAATKITIEIVTQFAAFKRGEIAPPETPEQLALRALTGLQSVVEKQREQLALAAPKAAALDRISTADGSYGLTEAAKILQVKPKALIAFMATSQWIYRRNNGKNWLAYQAKIDAGYLWHKIATYTGPNGEEKTRDTVKVLPKGLAKLAQIVPGAKIDPDLMQMEARPFAKKPEPAS